MHLLEMTWPDVDALPRETLILLPIAALEQHGRHLPLFTDSLLLGEIVRRVENQLSGSILAAPVLWIGNSHHHLDFPGTMSASPRVYLDLLHDMLENFLYHGFRRFLLLIGHGGNVIPARQALFEIRQRYRHRSDLVLLSGSYWSFGMVSGGSPTKLSQRDMGHACEWETSMMLSLRPDLVRNYTTAVDVTPNPPHAPAHWAWTTKDRSEVGHIGQPRLASAEKGELLFGEFTRHIIDFIRHLEQGAK